MKRKARIAMYKRTFAVAATLAVLFIPVSSFAAELNGTVVILETNTPVPGLEVQLWHPDIGESESVYTNESGEYYFEYIPEPPEVGDSIFDIELYWNGDLIFREEFDVGLHSTYDIEL
jgi:hypothetical protein